MLHYLPSAAFVRAMKMSSAPDSEIPSVSDDYSYVNSIDYSLQYTADISKHMQMPDRLAAVDGFRKMNFHADLSSASFMNESPAFAMTIPDKLVLGATDYQTDHSLQMVDHVVNGNVHDDKTVDYYEPVHHVTSADVQATPPKRRGDVDLFAAGDMVVPATPGSMLKSSSYSSRSGSVVDVGSDWLTIQRQVAKLTCRVERLEEENGRRHQREMLLYPLLLGFCLVQLARFLVSRSK